MLTESKQYTLANAITDVHDQRQPNSEFLLHAKRHADPKLHRERHVYAHTQPNRYTITNTVKDVHGQLQPNWESLWNAKQYTYTEPHREWHAYTHTNQHTKCNPHRYTVWDIE